MKNAPCNLRQPLSLWLVSSHFSHSSFFIHCLTKGRKQTRTLCFSLDDGYRDWILIEPIFLHVQILWRKWYSDQCKYLFKWSCWHSNVHICHRWLLEKAKIVIPANSMFKCTEAFFYNLSAFFVSFKSVYSLLFTTLTVNQVHNKCNIQLTTTHLRWSTDIWITLLKMWFLCLYFSFLYDWTVSGSTCWARSFLGRKLLIRFWFWFLSSIPFHFFLSTPDSSDLVRVFYLSLQKHVFFFVCT